MTKFVAYCRVSTDKEDQLNSLETQKRFFEEYAKKSGYHLVRIYADEGISGTKIKNRKQFLKLMEDAEFGEFEMVAVKDISRLARNAVDFLQCIRTLKSKNIACNFVNASLSSQDSEMILGTLALVAQEESANTSKRIKFSKRINAEKGRVPNLCYGYDKTVGDHFSLTINQAEAEVVRRIFHLYQNERLGQKKIADLLNSEGLFTKRNCCWSQNAVARILQNPIYIGKITNGKEEIADFLTGKRKQQHKDNWLICENPSLRIIGDEEFLAVQALISKINTSPAFQNRGGTHLFSTLLQCGDCNHAFRRVERAYQNRYIDWVCGGRNSNGKESCQNTASIAEQTLVSLLSKHLLSFLEKNPSILSQAIRIAKRRLAEQHSEFDEKACDEKISKLSRDKQKLIALHLDCLIDEGELREKLLQINEQTARLMQLKAESKHTTHDWLDEKTLTAEQLLTPESVTNAMLKSIIQRIVILPEGEAHLYFSEDLARS